MPKPVRWNMWDRSRAWYYRRFHWSAADRADYKLRLLLAGQPELRAIENRITAIQARPRPPEGSFEAWDRSESISYLAHKYESTLVKLAMALHPALYRKSIRS